MKSHAEIDEYRNENPSCRVIKSRWVLPQKAPGLVLAHLVGKDFADGRPSALDLGLSSNTASAEALKAILSRAAKGRMQVLGLDISTKLLSADIFQPTVIELPAGMTLLNSQPGFLILRKAMYRLRSASLSWQRHLARVMTNIGLTPSPLEPTLYSGWMQINGSWVFILALASVDDLLIASSTQEGVQHVYSTLSAVLKVKMAGKLHEDRLSVSCPKNVVSWYDDVGGCQLDNARCGEESRPRWGPWTLTLLNLDSRANIMVAHCYPCRLPLISR